MTMGWRSDVNGSEPYRWGWAEDLHFLFDNHCNSTIILSISIRPGKRLFLTWSDGQP